MYNLTINGTPVSLSPTRVSSAGKQVLEGELTLPDGSKFYGKLYTVAKPAEAVSERIKPQVRRGKAAETQAPAAPAPAQQDVVSETTKAVLAALRAAGVFGK